MRDYLKFGLCNILAILAIVSFLLGDYWTFLPLLFTTVLATVGDGVLMEDSNMPAYKSTWILNLFLYANLPLLFLCYFTLLWRLAPGDFLHFGASMDQILGTNILARKSLGGGIDLVGGFLSLGLVIGVSGFNVSHELIHRTWSKTSLEVGRWLAAFSWDGEFPVAHLTGHHRNVATWVDHDCGRRGENFYTFFVRSVIAGNKIGWKSEQEYLRKKKKPFYSHHNRIFRVWFYSALLAGLAFWAAGWIGVVFQIAVGLYGKAHLQIVGYIQHYGLVRVPKSPAHSRHSWNSNHSVSTWMLYNLSRHSHHHETGHLPFWRLEPKEEAPFLPFGYMTMMFIALCPPLYRHVMAPALAMWDRDFASAEEMDLLASYYTRGWLK